MTEKRAYAVVFEWDGSTADLLFHLRDAGFSLRGDDGEIRPRVAPGEEWKSIQGYTLPELLQAAAGEEGVSTLANDLVLAAEHFRRRWSVEPLPAAPEGPEAPRARVDYNSGESSPAADGDGHQGTAGEAGTAATRGTCARDVATPASGAGLLSPDSRAAAPGVPSALPRGLGPYSSGDPANPSPSLAEQGRYSRGEPALPEKVVCEHGPISSTKPHPPDPMCVNPRRVYPPDARTEQEIQLFGKVKCVHGGLPPHDYNEWGDCAESVSAAPVEPSLGDLVAKTRASIAAAAPVDPYGDMAGCGHAPDALKKLSPEELAKHPGISRETLEQALTQGLADADALRAATPPLPGRIASSAPVDPARSATPATPAEPDRCSFCETKEGNGVGIYTCENPACGRKCCTMHSGDQGDGLDRLLCEECMNALPAEPEKLGEVEALRAENDRLLSALVSAAHALNCAAAWIEEMGCSCTAERRARGGHERGCAGAAGSSKCEKAAAAAALKPASNPPRSAPSAGPSTVATKGD